MHCNVQCNTADLLLQQPVIAADGEPSEDQYRTLLLLKALQAVLGVWEAERVQRATRGGEESAGQSDSCRLQSLVIDMEDYVLKPSEVDIGNCEGKCGFPLPKGTNHAILLNHQVEKGHWTGRAPCCVPTEYDLLQIIQVDKHGTTISTKDDIKAKECGCR